MYSVYTWAIHLFLTLVGYTSKHPPKQDKVHNFRAAVIHKFPKNALKVLHEENKLLEIPTT
jgi:hypothetical protein